MDKVLNTLCNELETTLAKVGVDIKFNMSLTEKDELQCVVIYRGQKPNLFTFENENPSYGEKRWVDMVHAVTEYFDITTYTAMILRIVLKHIQQWETDTPPIEEIKFKSMPIQFIPFSSIILTSIFATMVTFITCMVVYEQIKPLLPFVE